MEPTSWYELNENSRRRKDDGATYHDRQTLRGRRKIRWNSSIDAVHRQMSAAPWDSRLVLPGCMGLEGLGETNQMWNDVQSDG